MKVVRHEFINILASVVECFPEYSEIADLDLLRSKEDPETDFFKNIVHIQLTRRSRALQRLSQSLETTPLRGNTLVQYLVPMCGAILSSDAYVKHNFLLDAAVGAMEGICRWLTWSQYSSLLRFYLNALPLSISKQKLYVR